MADTTTQIGSGLEALMHEYQTLTNNLANVNTTGFKRVVSSLSRELMDRRGEAPPGDSDLPLSELAARQALDFRQGNLQRTGRQLDVGLEGEGFLVIETPEGPRYTRNGVLQINPQGMLVDVSGNPVGGEGGPIVIPANVSELDLNIARDGRISAGELDLGRLRVAEFGGDRNRLQPVGASYYSAPADVVPAEATESSVRQGFREGSNVNMMEEMVNMIAVSRMYEYNVGLMKRQRELSRSIMSVANA